MPLHRTVLRLAVLAAAGLAAISPRVASAGSYVGKFKVYTDRATWQADAAAPRTTVDLSGSGPLSSASGVSFGVVGGTSAFPELLAGALTVTPLPATVAQLMMQFSGGPSGVGFDLTSSTAGQSVDVTVTSPLFPTGYGWTLDPLHASTAGQTQFFGVLPLGGTCGTFLGSPDLPCPTQVLSVELSSLAEFEVSNIELAAHVSAVPEPASLALTGLGLATLGAGAFRARRRTV